MQTSQFSPFCSSFGVAMPERSWSGDYRYGFEGQEGDDEMYVGSAAFKFRIEDSRLGRFLSVDPAILAYPEYSPYHFSSNQPIHSSELEGLENSEDLNRPQTVDDLNFFERAVFGLILGTQYLGEKINVANGVSLSENPRTRSQQNFRAGVTTVAEYTFLFTGHVEMCREAGSSTGPLKYADDAADEAIPASRKLMPILGKITSEIVESTSSSQSKIVIPQAKQSPIINKVASATTSQFHRCETIGGNAASKRVGYNIALLRRGESLAPIHVAEIDGEKYILDGHHRFQSAKLTGRPVNYNIVAPSDYSKYGYHSAEEILNAAANSAGQEVKLDNRKVAQGIKENTK